VASIKSDQFEFKETWVIFVTILWCMMQVLAVVFNLPMKAMVCFQIVSMACLIVNFEQQSEEPSEMRFKAFPLIFFFNFIPLLALR
jgi:hypothetical protein